MSDIAIRVENIGKKYYIGGPQQKYTTLRDKIADTLVTPFRRAGKLLKGHATGAAELDHELWALDDISFEVKYGEKVGIIGRNGAGKSTLLKLLSRITEPTTGFIRIRGRVGSLLEVGTGFHPELTGRENVYLNGAILGMKQTEIIRKFDEIVAFSEIETFIDTPVKHYSTGMRVRLAFAVAAHLDPEILIIDEVLAVGDVAFQKKCLGKMDSVAKQGRTVLFVSHNMAAVEQLTHRSLLLENGKLLHEGLTIDVVGHYLNTLMGGVTTVYNVENTPRGNAEFGQKIKFLCLELENNFSPLLPADADIHLRFTVQANETIDSFCFSGTIVKIDGVPVGNLRGPQIHSINRGEIAEYRMVLKDLRLAPGKYYWKIAMGTGDIGTKIIDFDIVQNVLHFEVLSPEGEDGTRAVWNPRWGSIRFNEPAIIRVK